MQPLAFTAQMKELDRLAIQERGIPSLELMENAARALAEGVRSQVGPLHRLQGDGPGAVTFGVLRKEKGGEQPTPEEQRELDELRDIVESQNTDPIQRIAVLCGPGNNGGDGIAAARLLLESGYQVRTFLVGDRAKMTPDSRAMEEKLAAAGGALESFRVEDQRAMVWLSTCSCLVDALFGVGLKRPLEGDFLAAVRWMNSMRTPVVSCDLPSGVDGDTGEVLGEAVRADLTVTFTCAKPGLCLGEGAGLVFLGVPREVYPIVAVKCDEAMPFPLPEEYEKILEKARSCDVALIGPGLGRAPRTERLVRSLLSDLEIPVVLDADGINALAGHIHILDGRRAPTVLTPHAGEFARLTGQELPVRDKVGAARDFAGAHRCTLVLKGRGTVTASPEGRVWINGTGGPGMAKGGSGDVLAGMIAALWGQKHLNGPDSNRSELAALAVWYHGAAGDRCAGRLGEYAMLPTDLIETLPEILKENQME